MASFVTCIAIAILLCGYQDSVLASEEKVLYAHLLTNYTQGRPVSSWTEPVEVEVTYDLYYLQSLDGGTQEMEVLGALQMKWIDPDLSWNPADFNGLYSVTVEATKIWTPTLMISNAAEEVRDVDWINLFPVRILFTGEITWRKTLTLKVLCDLSMRTYPYDIQICFISIENAVHMGTEVNLTLPVDGRVMNGSMLYYYQSKEYDISEYWNARTEYQVHEDPYVAMTSIHTIIPIKRKPLYQVLNIVIPACTLSMMSILVFAVPIDAGEKLSLAITVLLSFSVFLIVLSDNTSQASGNMPLLTEYLAVTIIVNGICIFLTILVLRMHHTEPPRPMPRWMQRIMFCYFGRLIGMTGGMANKVMEKDLKTNNAMDKEGGITSKTGGGSVSPEPTKLATVLDGKENLKNSQDPIQQVLHELKTITGYLEDKEQEEVYREQWKLAARILDKIFLIIFGPGIFLLTIFMVIILPHINESPDPFAHFK